MKKKKKKKRGREIEIFLKIIVHACFETVLKMEMVRNVPRLWRQRRWFSQNSGS